MKKSKYNYVVNGDNGSVIVNTVTGGVVQLTSDEYHQFVENSLPIETMNNLLDQGVYVDDQIDEISSMRVAYRNAIKDKRIARITICPTLECNFSCPYCYERRIKGKMDSNVQNGVIKDIEKIYDAGVETIKVTWYGGEPLLYPEIIKDMTQRIQNIAKERKKDCSFNIITNGYLIVPEIIDFFKEIKISTIQITVDGSEKVHNTRRIPLSGEPSFERIVNNIFSLTDVGLNVNVRVNLDKENMNEYDKVKEIFSNNNNVLCYPAFITQEDTQGAEQRERCIRHDEYGNYIEKQKIDYNAIDLKKLLKPKVSTCMACHQYSFVYSPKGEVYKCINDVCIPEFALRSVTDEIVDGQKAKSRYLERDPFTENECDSCVFLPLCYGRCVWEYQDKKTHMCPDVRYLLKDIIKHKYNLKEEKDDSITGKAGTC